MRIAALFAIILSIITLVYASFRIDRLEDAVHDVDRQRHELNNSATENHHREFELADKMSALQRFTAKLYFAGQHQNNDLMKFYLHELEETMEGIADANIMEDGVDISQNMESYGLKVLETVEKRIHLKSGNFNTQYQNLINGCNACHKVSKHGFIKIEAPKDEHVFNQVFGQ